MFRSMTNPFANDFKIPGLKSRILFMLGLVAICRLMAWINF
jgi:preprotein translocase subunit SecY